MKQRPILFSTEMVEAILEGRKTQTRRVIKPQPMLQDRADDRVRIYQRGHTNLWEVKDKLSSDGFSTLNSFRCPYGKPGDVLWLRETFMRMPREGFFQYKAHHSSFKSTDLKIKLLKEEGLKWKPAIHMPKEACRIFLRITDVRVERLQEISREDAVAEGIKPIEEGLQFGGVDYPGNWYVNYRREGYSFLTALESFQSLWESINGEQSWNDNPWVWVIEFERVEGEKL